MINVFVEAERNINSAAEERNKHLAVTENKKERGEASG